MPLMAEHELYRRLVAARPLLGPQTAPPVGHAPPEIPGRVGEAVAAALAADRGRWPHLDAGLTCLLDTGYLLVCGDINAAGRALGEAGYGHLLVRAGAVAADMADALAASGLAATVRPDVWLASPPGLHHLTTVAIGDPARTR